MIAYSNILIQVYLAFDFGEHDLHASVGLVRAVQAERVLVRIMLNNIVVELHENALLAALVELLELLDFDVIKRVHI